jgi:hypothetical protein
LSLRNKPVGFAHQIGIGADRWVVNGAGNALIARDIVVGQEDAGLRTGGRCHGDQEKNGGDLALHGGLLQSKKPCRDWQGWG